MNLKYYLRGLGIGLIVTTIILTISNNTGSASGNNTGSGSQIPQETTASGSVIAFDRQQTTENETQPVTEPATEAATEPATTQPATQPVTTQAATVSTESATTTAVSADGSEVTVVIKNVYYGTQAADILYDAGLITDKSEFVQYLMSSGYGTKIQEGVYSIPKGSSYESICQTISKNK